jgi:hypothetical protein
MNRKVTVIFIFALLVSNSGLGAELSPSCGVIDSDSGPQPVSNNMSREISESKPPLSFVDATLIRPFVNQCEDLQGYEFANDVTTTVSDVLTVVCSFYPGKWAKIAIPIIQIADKSAHRYLEQKIKVSEEDCRKKDSVAQQAIESAAQANGIPFWLRQ